MRQLILVALAALGILLLVFLFIWQSGAERAAQPPVGSDRAGDAASVCDVCVVVEERALYPGEESKCGTRWRETLLEREQIVEMVCSPDDDLSDSSNDRRVAFLVCPACMFDACPACLEGVK